MESEINTHRRLDGLDLAILKVLQTNAELTNAQLGELVNAGPDANGRSSRNRTSCPARLS